MVWMKKNMMVCLALLFTVTSLYAEVEPEFIPVLEDMKASSQSSSSDMGKVFTNFIGMNFVYIAPGSFMMGSNDGGSHEKPMHWVNLTKGYYMQTTEVTQGQWYDVMGTKPWSGKQNVKEGRNHAAAWISWNDANKFVRKLNQMEGKNVYRLPTEAEWEYACRAGNGLSYSFGDSESDLASYAWYDKNARDIGEKYAHGVGLKEPNKWGLYDMHGNVWEWCEDQYGDYPSGSVTDPVGTFSGSSYVARGGSWYFMAWYCRSAYRCRYGSDYRESYLGFRLLRLQAGSWGKARSGSEREKHQEGLGGLNIYNQMLFSL